MKRIIPMLLVIAVLLCGCSPGAEESFVKFISQTAGAETLSFTAEVRAEFAYKTLSFTLGFDRDSDGAVIEVIKPALLAGVRARIRDGETVLEYEGAMLDVGELTDGMSPLSAVPMLYRAMTDGHIELAWEEDGLLAARLIPEDNIAVTLLITPELVPVRAEISDSERTLVFIEINDWKLN